MVKLCVESSFYIYYSKKKVEPGASQNGLQSIILPLSVCAQMLSPSPRRRRCKVGLSSVSAAEGTFL